MADTEVVPQNILDEADRLYPSDIHYPYGVASKVDDNYSVRQIYIAGAVAERARTQERVSFLMAQSFEGWSQEAINGYTTAMSSILDKDYKTKK